jgi:hypothetical protein
MSQRPLIFLAALFVSLNISTTARAQSNASGPSATPPEQTDQSSPQIAPITPSQAAAKKVWTNDDLNGLRGNAPASSAGASNSESAKSTNKPAPAGKNTDAKSYHDQIAKLQAQIPPIDSQIAELQSAIDGKPTGDAKESARPRGVKIDDWSVEMEQLQQKHDDIQTRIDALEDQARHHGVAPNALP